jgi:hypothetical protein
LFSKLKVLLRALEHHQIKFGIMLRYTPLPVGIQTAIFAVSFTDSTEGSDRSN